MRLLEGLPVPGNIVLDGLGQKLIDLITEWIARSLRSGRVARSKGLPHLEHEMQETLFSCVLLVPCMFNNWLFNRGGAGVLVSKCSCDVFPFPIFKTRFPFPC